MITDITFQYLAPGASRPDDITLTDVHSILEANSFIPAPGDIVTMAVCCPESERGKLRSFKVLARNFVYAHNRVDNDGIGEIIGCSIFVIATDVKDDEVGVDFKE